MVALTRLNGKGFYLNSDLIRFIEETPDTVITLNDGIKIVVTERAEDVIEHIAAYRSKIFRGLPIHVNEKLDLDTGGR